MAASKASFSAEAGTRPLLRIFETSFVVSWPWLGCRPASIARSPIFMNSLQLGGQGKTVSLGFSVPAAMIDALGGAACPAATRSCRSPAGRAHAES